MIAEIATTVAVVAAETAAETTEEAVEVAISAHPAFPVASLPRPRCTV